MVKGQGDTYIEGLGTYQYDQDVYDYLMQDGQRTRDSLLTEVLERAINDDHKGDGIRTLVRKLRKGELAAMVAEWETATRQNEREASSTSEAYRRARAITCPSCQHVGLPHDVCTGPPKQPSSVTIPQDEIEQLQVLVALMRRYSAEHLPSQNETSLDGWHHGMSDAYGNSAAWLSAWAVRVGFPVGE